MAKAERRVTDDALTASIARKTDGKPPNILMIFSDEHNAFMTGYAGHSIVRTPNMDRLAAEGVAFDNAYCNSPLCSPSRQSFMAGLYCYHIGMWDNTASMPAETVTWAHMLSAGRAVDVHAGIALALAVVVGPSRAQVQQPLLPVVAGPGGRRAQRVGDLRHRVRADVRGLSHALGRPAQFGRVVRVPILSRSGAADRAEVVADPPGAQPDERDIGVPGGR